MEKYKHGNNIQKQLYNILKLKKMKNDIKQSNTRFFTTTNDGKLDIIVTLYDKRNSMIAQRRSTYNTKPTFKELKELYKPYKKEGAVLIHITTTPSCNSKTFKL